MAFEKKTVGSMIEKILIQTICLINFFLNLKTVKFIKFLEKNSIDFF